MIISFVVAASENNVIGKDGQLPWHLPNDLKHFKNVTWSMPVLMGRKTLESFKKPLPGRKNIVLTRREDYNPEGVFIVHSTDEAEALVKEMDVKEMMVIGGGELFKMYFSKASKIYLTRVHATVEGDTFIPEISKSEWQLTSRQHYEADEKHAYDYSFETWERK